MRRVYTAAPGVSGGRRRITPALSKRERTGIGALRPKPDNGAADRMRVTVRGGARMADAFEESLARARRLAGPLDARLAIVREAYRSLLPAYDGAVDRFVGRLVAARAGRSAPGPGEPFPDFALPDQTGRIRRLSVSLRDGPVVVAFHRGGWCEICQLALQALAEIEPRLRSAGVGVLAVSPQRAAAAAAHRAAAGAAFPMLADIGGGVATLAGLTVTVDEELAAQFAGFGLDLAAINGDAGRTIPIPATFLLGRDGRVASRWLDPDPRRRADMTALVQAAIPAAGPL
jgi:peroxiredoxin